MNVTEQYRAARDRLLALAPTEAAEKFVWPSFESFNFGLDWFDALGNDPARADQPALIVTGDDGTVSGDICRTLHTIHPGCRVVPVARGDAGR